MNRRNLLSVAAPAALILSSATVAAVAASAVHNPDAELIQTCQQFAETEFTLWYRDIAAPDGEVEFQDTTPDWATLHWIEATPAITPEGMRAKALALGFR